MRPLRSQPTRPLLLAGLLAASLLAGCVSFELPQESGGAAVLMPEPPEPSAAPALSPQDHGDLRVVWPASVDPRYAPYLAALQEDGRFEAWIASVNGRLALPYDVPIRHAECGMANAYYSPTDKEVVLCWEMLREIATTFRDPSIDSETQARVTGSTWLFVAFHEMGHALVDAYGLPVTGREEDAVDDLATLLLIHAGASDAAIDAASFWQAVETGQHSAEEFADEHSLSGQRFYAILCLVYGSQPREYAWLVDEGYLPTNPERCVREYERKDASWFKLLEPWEITSGS